MKFGVQLPEAEYEATWPEIRDMARIAEDSGFDSIWLGDHLLYRFETGPAGPWEAWSMLAALAAVTERVTLGPLVAATPFHSPAMLAKKAATVDEISGGRLVLGLGAGWNRLEFDAFGFPYDQRVSRFAEAFEIIRRLLTTGEADFEGRFYTIRECELHPRPRLGGPPLMIGSNGERMLGLTLPYVEYWNSWYRNFNNQVDDLRPLMAKIEQSAVELGRAPGEVRKTVALLVAFESIRAPSRYVETTPAITGSITQMAEALAGFAGAGVDHVMLVLDPITADSVAAAAEVVASARDLISS
ncbi:MAG TPA: LLM class flavin-dependent oxidoreductase [Acidimicrobiia bacterium]|jgi:probable F420-dependent oxidoreductase